MSVLNLQQFLLIREELKEYGNSSLILNHCKADTKSICYLTGSTNRYFSKSK